MKSQNGVTMISLIVYVASFLVITATIAGITTFFYSNNEILDTSIGSTSGYSKFNMYFLNECKKTGNALSKYYVEESDGAVEDGSTAISSSTEPQYYLTFTDGTTTNSFIYDSDNDLLYYNYIKLCDEVEKFYVQIDTSTGKTILNVFIQIDGTAFTTKYVMES